MKLFYSMGESADAPKVEPAGLVTLAFLKAQLDGGSGPLDVFMPLIAEVINRSDTKYFSVLDVQDELHNAHGLLMPQETIYTLLKSATEGGFLFREGGRFFKTSLEIHSDSELEIQKEEAAKSQERLAGALRQHAMDFSLSIDSDKSALSLLLRYLQSSQVALLLGLPVDYTTSTKTVSDHEYEVTSHFISSLVNNDISLREIFQKLLQGFALYNAAFRQYSLDNGIPVPLYAYFDTPIVIRALGYEGEAQEKLAMESIQFLASIGISCRVFDKSIYELKGLLQMYQSKIRTISGRESLRQTNMTRFFLQNHFSPGDLRQQIALVEHNINRIGLQIQTTSIWQYGYNYDTRPLAKRLSSPSDNNNNEPRISHDIDCISAICALRKQIRPYRIEDSQYIFVATSPMVIRNVRRWWIEDEMRTDIPPIIHIAELINIAWLREPRTKSELHIQNLVALCETALRPSQKTWERFISHLRKLHKDNSLTRDEVDLIITSTLTQQCLQQIEIRNGLSDDLDAATMDEVVDRVKHEYISAYEQKLVDQQHAYEKRISNLEMTLTLKSKTAQKLAEGVARRISTAIFMLLSILILIATAKGVQISLGFGLFGIVSALGVLILTFVGLIGNLKEIKIWMSGFEHRLVFLIKKRLP